MNKLVPWVVTGGALLVFVIFIAGQASINPYAANKTQVKNQHSPIIPDGISTGTTTVSLQKLSAGDTNDVIPSASKPKDMIVWADEMSNYSSHGGSIYLNGAKIEGADVQSFQIVMENPFPRGKYDGAGLVHYAKDKNNVYYDGKVIHGAISQNFRVVWTDAIESEQVFAVDEMNVYYRGKVLEPKAEPKYFVPLAALSNGWRVGGSYSHDRNHIYYENKGVDGADLHTFNSEYEDGYASDKDHVFLKGKVVPGVAPNDFIFPIHEP